MQKTALQKLLKNIAEGVCPLTNEVCTKLAEQLVYVLTQPMFEDDAEIAKFTVTRLLEEGQSVVPLFTSQQLLHNWRELHDSDGEITSFLCADICTALNDDSHIIFDPETDHSLVIEPSWVKVISAIEPEGLD